MQNAKLTKKKYYKYRDGWEHDHCEFCSTKFSESAPDSLRNGYVTDDNYHWICEPCFNDFKNKFNWQTVAHPTDR